ncbi:MAG: U32 family peptidase [Candidatus Margulisbacteria bacterium]|nr:U32 family peptidase [Candidatus Margulisiibacteriota bacterium]
MTKPLIVAPGGSYEKAIIALNYGADAVYVATNQFSLRKSASNFTLAELESLCEIAHARKKKVYLALNIFFHQSDIDRAIPFLASIQGLGIDALIISDLGVCALASEHTTIPIHASTQASIMNEYSAALWSSMGATRVVLARETSLAESMAIKTAVGVETEVFIHGAMCSSFSGKCTISNVASGRDSNRGGCIQSCRHSYQLSNGDVTYIMNSKDLMGLGLVPDYFKYRVDAVKIEGRMKSALYVANACQQYRLAIDAFADDPGLFYEKKDALKQQLSRVSNRGFTQASLARPANESSISYDWNGYSSSHQFMGIVVQSQGGKSLVSTKQPLKHGEVVSYIQPNNADLCSHTVQLQSLLGHPLSQASPNQWVWIDGALPAHSLLVQ